MEFGVQKKQFHDFYSKILATADSNTQKNNASMPEKYLSLRLVSEFDFVNFAQYWSDFQNCLFATQIRHSDLKIT